MNDRDAQAFPDTGCGMWAPSPGMSIRDYFAAKFAHAELLSAGSLKGPALALAEEAQRSGMTVEEQIAFNAYLLADAMLAERSKP